MPPKKNKKIGCNATITTKLLSFLNCLGITNTKETIQRYEVICLTKKDKIDIYLYHKELKPFITSNLPNLYIHGVHIATIKKDKLLPYLGLLSLLRVNNIEVTRSYVVVSDEGEKLFLYGRDILPQSIIKIERPSSRCPKIVVVMNTQGDLLGWGYLIRKGSNQFLIRNLIDAGWYLRSGV